MRRLAVLTVIATAAVAHAAPLSITDGAYWRQYPADAKALITAPARWRAPHWALAGLVTVSGITCYAFDAEIRKAAQQNRSDAGDAFFGAANYAGDGTVTLPLLALLYAGGKLTDREITVTAALTGLESFVLANLATQTLKHLLQRHRPFTGDSRAAWDGPSLTAGYKSFPSGHTTAAFSIASALAGTWDNAWAYAACYGTAACAGLARVYFDKHWASDVFAGAVIGTVTGHALARYRRNEQDQLSHLPVTITPAGLIWRW